MNNAIGKEFHFASLIRFALPSIVAMMVMSLYTIVDGVFVSRFVGTNALSAVNIAYPLINVIIAVAIMLGTGGSAIIARLLGEGKPEKARDILSFMMLIAVLASVVIGGVGLLFLDPICRALGATEALLPYCKQYLGILLAFAPACTLQMMFQALFITAGAPTTGLVLTILAGLTNALLDYLLIVPLGLGIAGAAIATAAGYLIPAVYGICFFSRRKGVLYLVRPRANWRMLAQACGNGSSEMVTNLSTSIVTLLFNLLMIRMLGADGVAAITIVLYAQFLLTAVFIGFSLGVAPVISYNYGQGNNAQLHRIFKICILTVAVFSTLMFLCAMLGAPLIVGIFSSKDTAVYQIALHGFFLFSINYLFAGINIFSSALFTAFSDGKISALISFLRTFGFILAGFLILPPLFQINGVWLAVPLAELLTLTVSLHCLRRGRKKYHYA